MSELSPFYGPNAGYVLELYERYQRDPQSVDEATRAIFEHWSPNGEVAPPSGPALPRPLSQKPFPPPPPESKAPAPAAPQINIDKVVKAARIARLIREIGHLSAHIDPLGSPPLGDPDLELGTHGLTPQDLEALPASVVGGPLAKDAANALVALDRLRKAYSGSIGYEDDHIQIKEERTWLREAAESGRFLQGIDAAYKKVLLERLTEVEAFERYLHTTFVGQKRFSLEGTDMLIPMLDLIIHGAAVGGTLEVLLGMAHRGRLNVLAHILNKPYSAILAGFVSTNDEKSAVSGGGQSGWTGDVKYHLGGHLDYTEEGLGQMPITLAPNPSHLEFVNPVIIGRTRAAQECRDEPGPPGQSAKAAGAILIHGDAAFPGQGVVAETLNLSQIPGYNVGGTIHIILNNQIGFTTSPKEGRSTLYASDLAKGFEIPIVHVNADDPGACIAAARMALAYCTQFHKDFLIDLVGYRRWGHNEGDEPTYTQPRMYETIAHHPTVRDIWARGLEREGIVTREGVETMVKRVQKRLQDAREEATKVKVEPTEEFGASRTRRDRPVDTAVSAERLVEMNEKLLSRPEGFIVVPKLERSLQRRRQSIHEPGGIDWGHAEALAFASILGQGTPIRITGQDTERGTFSHRHLVLHDPHTGQRYIPHQSLPGIRASFAIHNSPLSENAVLGFEYGYSMHATETLVLWEAQFGDFANGAQVIIDQFIVAGNAKWQQTPSLVLLLPHGYEGQGPEHSSARLERFLQLAAGDNIRVVNCTTSAQYFHVLRRQAALLETVPRPLIVMSPKSLLRHPLAGSSLADLSEGRFHPVLDDPRGRERASQVTRLILCTGKIYVDLVSHEAFEAAERVAVIRLEELNPFPVRELQEAISHYPNVRDVVWMQEEPRNMGAWVFVRTQIRDLIGPEIDMLYVGRPASSSPSEGSLKQHRAEQNRIVTTALKEVPELKSNASNGPKRQREEVSHAR